MASLMTFSSSAYGDSCSTALVPRECGTCVDSESGRVRAVAFVRKDYAILDPTDPLMWAYAIYFGYAIIIPEVIGTYNGGENQTADGFGDALLRVTGKNHQGEFQELYNPRQRDFWNAMSANAGLFRMFLVGEKYIRDTIKPVTLQVTDPIAEITTTNLYAVTFSFSYNGIIKPHDKPALIFDNCASLEALMADYCPPCATPSGSEPVCPTDCPTLGLYGTFKS